MSENTKALQIIIKITRINPGVYQSGRLQLKLHEASGKQLITSCPVVSFLPLNTQPSDTASHSNHSLHNITHWPVFNLM